MPEGFSFKSGRVWIRGEGRAGTLPWTWNGGAPVDEKTGEFGFLAPPGGKLKIMAFHSQLTADEAWEGGAEDGPIVFRLVEGPMVRFVLPDYKKTGSSVEVRLYREGKKVRTLFARFRGGAWFVGGFEAGTYMLWINVPDSTPYVMCRQPAAASRSSILGFTVSARACTENGMAISAP